MFFFNVGTPNRGEPLFWSTSMIYIWYHVFLTHIADNKTTPFVGRCAPWLSCMITDKANAMIVSADYDWVKKTLRLAENMWDVSSVK